MGTVNRRRALTVFGGAAATLLTGPSVTRAEAGFPVLRKALPEQAGLDPVALAGVDDVIAGGLGGRFPGAVLLVARHGMVVRHTAYGHAQTHRDGTPLDRPRPMREGTLFDLASCTKVLATTAALMGLADDGRLGLDDPVRRWLPEIADERITVRRLLTHTAGLWEWQPVYLWAAGASAALSYVYSLPTRYEIGAGRHYSDLGFMLLGELAGRVAGMPMTDYVRNRVHRPLAMVGAGYRPGARQFAAATSLGNAYEQRMIDTGQPYPILGDRRSKDFRRWRHHTLVGEVNDGNAAYAFHGVAGHAGLFGTAWDVAVFAQTVANGGGYGGLRIFREQTVAEFTRDQFDPGQGLGFWTHRFAGTPGLGNGGVGHAGFTGTEFATDPATGLVVVLLTNRLHPDQPHPSIAPVWSGVLAALGRALRD